MFGLDILAGWIAAALVLLSPVLLVWLLNTWERSRPRFWLLLGGIVLILFALTLPF